MTDNDDDYTDEAAEPDDEPEEDTEFQDDAACGDPPTADGELP